MDDSNNPMTSRYNEANLNILRLHRSWLMCRNYRSNAVYDKWKWELDNIWSELCQDVTKDKLHDYQTIEKENTTLRLNIGKAKKRDDLYEALNNRHNFLRKLQERLGKGGVWSDGSEDHFD